MGMSAQHNGIVFSQYPSHPVPCCRILVLAVIIPPEILCAVVRKDRTMDQHEDISGIRSLGYEACNFLIIRLVEVNDNEGVRSDAEREIGRIDLHSKFRGHSGRHIIQICLTSECVILGPDIVIPGYSDKRHIRKLRLYPPESIVQHAEMGLYVSSIALNDITGLINQSGIVIDKAGSPLQQPRRVFLPHFGIPDKLLAVSRLPFSIGNGIALVINALGSSIIMRIPQHYHGIGSILAAPSPP